MKKCSKCKIEKEFTEFHKQLDRKSGYQSHCKDCLYKHQRDRWKSRKIKAISLFGGKCKKCGYNKNYAALEFHHLNQNEKEFDWSRLKLRSWDSIVKELKKCMLVCSNCHRELHNPQQEYETLRFEELNDNNFLNLIKQPTGNCLECDCEVYGTKFCSHMCARLNRRKVNRPKTKAKLEALINIHGFSGTGRIFNVSDNAIRKWLKQYNS